MSKEKEIRFCIWCGKIVPNFRQERAKTCSRKCSGDYNHAGQKNRDIRKSKSEEIKCHYLKTADQ